MALRAMQTFAAWSANEGAGKTNTPFLAQHSLVVRESTGPARSGPPPRRKT
jgi:LacI family transcriptional regulator